SDFFAGRTACAHEVAPRYPFTRWRWMAVKFGRGRTRALGRAPYADSAVDNDPGMTAGGFAPFFPLPPRATGVRYARAERANAADRLGFLACENFFCNSNLIPFAASWDEQSGDVCCSARNAGWPLRFPSGTVTVSRKSEGSAMAEKTR